MKNDLIAWLRHYVSHVFLMMLFASFVLWYIAKLSYTYTTDLDIDIQVADRKFEVECVIEGVGTNLFGYRLYKGRMNNIPLSELDYVRLTDQGQDDMLEIDPKSIQKAISVRYSDIKVVSVGAIPNIEVSRERETDLLKW